MGHVLRLTSPDQERAKSGLFTALQAAMRQKTMLTGDVAAEPRMILAKALREMCPDCSTVKRRPCREGAAWYPSN